MNIRHLPVEYKVQCQNRVFLLNFRDLPVEVWAKGVLLWNYIKYEGPAAFVHESVVFSSKGCIFWMLYENADHT
jgi:hypothetical protein